MICPLYRTRCLQLFRSPRKQTFCLKLFWVRKPRGVGDGRKAEQAWPFFGRAAHWSVCHSVPRCLPKQLKHSPAWRFIRSGHTWTTRQGRRDTLIQGVLRVESTPLGSYVTNVSVFDVFTGLHQQGHSDRKSMAACCTLLFKPTCHLEDMRRIKRKHRHRRFPSLQPPLLDFKIIVLENLNLIIIKYSTKSKTPIMWICEISDSWVSPGQNNLCATGCGVFIQIRIYIIFVLDI